MSEMDDESQNLHWELAGHERVDRLPITALMIERITAANDNNNIEPDDAIGPILAAIASLEELIRETLGL